MCFPYVVGIRIMSIHISCDMYLRLGLHVQISLYYVLPCKAKISAQHGIGFILDRCIVYLELTMPNLQKKRLLIFEIFNIKKCTHFFGSEYIISDGFQDSEDLDHASQKVRSDLGYTLSDSVRNTLVKVAFTLLLLFKFYICVGIPKKLYTRQENFKLVIKSICQKSNSN